MNFEELECFPKVLLITGNGKNVGKTTLACKILSRYQKNYEIIALKISTHFHDYSQKDKVIFKNEKFIIIEELRSGTGKDSSKMLDSGAKRVFFLMVKDENLAEAFNYLINNEDIKDYPFIIESTSLRGVINPGLFIVIENIKTKNVKTYLKPFLHLIDQKITFDGQHDFDYRNIIFDGKKWSLQL